MESEHEVVKNMKLFKADNKSKRFTPLAQAKNRKRDMNKLILGIWVRLSEAKEYAGLAQRMEEFGLRNSERMNDFFRKEGPYLLRCSTLQLSSPQPLRFICEHVPIELLKEVLRSNNYSNINGFLIGQSALEKKGLINQEKLMERDEKIKLLLEIDLKGLENYVETGHFKTQFSEGIRESFLAEIQRCKLAKLKI
jgi:hypothetical protein